MARFREVQTGIADEGRVEIASGLTEGARVVTTGALAIRDGERISVTSTPAGRATGPRGQGDAIQTSATPQ
ncbi:hypothetical protein D3C83_113630 [compost metagenome]